MTDRELEQKLADAIKRTAPNDLDAILPRCGEQNGSVMELKPKKKTGRWLAAACAALVLLGAGGGGLLYHQSYAVASVVSLDVNPSIELKVNRNEKVLSCTALNEEAAAVLFAMDGGADLKGTKVDVAVNAIVGALVRAGYLDSFSSAILISVEDNDQERAARLQAELVASVDGVLQTQAPNTAVLSQTFPMDAGTGAVYGSGISMGKSALVQNVLAMNGAGDGAFDQLAALSVEELNDLLETGETRIPIGKDEAARTVIGSTGLSIVNYEVDAELDEVPAHYEVELDAYWGVLEYTVDAFTGDILSGPGNVSYPISAPQTSAVTAPEPAAPAPVPETPSVTPQPPAVTTPQNVGQEAAKQAALNHAGLTDGQVTNWKIERDWDDGRLEYEIEFWCGTSEYEYTIDGHSCAVLEHEVDHHQESSHHSSGHHGGHD